MSSALFNHANDNSFMYNPGHHHLRNTFTTMQNCIDAHKRNPNVSWKNLRRGACPSHYMFSKVFGDFMEKHHHKHNKCHSGSQRECYYHKLTMKKIFSKKYLNQKYVKEFVKDKDVNNYLQHEIRTRVETDLRDRV